MILEPIVLSSTDGIITVFNLLVGLNAAEFSKSNLFVIIMIAIVGDSISMAISYYNSKLGEREQSLDLLYESLYNIIAFVFFGLLCLIIFMIIADKPSVLLSYLSIIIPLLLLGYIQNKYTDGKIDNKLSLFLGLIGSFITYVVGKSVRFFA